MKMATHKNKLESDSSQSFGKVYRLKYGNQWSNSSRQQKSRRISETQKERLIFMVTCQNYRIKQAGRLLGISYSTAKKIFNIFRNGIRGKKQEETDSVSRSVVCGVCSVEDIKEVGMRKVEIISTIAGGQQWKEGVKNFIFA